jgi:hypothetical protein
MASAPAASKHIIGASLEELVHASMRERTAAIIGFLVVPVIPGLMFGILTPLQPKGINWLDILGLLPIGYAYSLVATMVLAVPAFLVFQRTKLIRWWSSMLTGFVVGALVSVVLQWPSFQGLPSPNGNVLIYALTGCTSGLVFWLIWRRGR